MLTSEHSRIFNNISATELSELLKALQRKELKEIRGTGIPFGESVVWEVEFKNSRYQIHKIMEEIISVWKLKLPA